MSFDEMPGTLERVDARIARVEQMLDSLISLQKDDHGRKISKAEALDIVQVTMQTLNAWMRESDIPVYYTPKGRPYFFDKELQEWMRSRGNKRQSRADEILHGLAKKRAS